jgi:hypothetical protein
MRSEPKKECQQWKEHTNTCLKEASEHATVGLVKAYLGKTTHPHD